MTLRRYHGYNFTYPVFTFILDNEDADDSVYSPSDYEKDDEYPSFHYDDIFETYIARVYFNINYEDADNNTYDSNTGVHNYSNINTTDNIDLLQPLNDANTEDEDTK